MANENGGQTVQGHLEIFPKGFGFLRDINKNFHATNEDVFVPEGLIRKLKLREGVHLKGIAREQNGKSKQNAQMVYVEQINGKTLDQYTATTELKNRISISPEDRIHLSLGKNDRMGRILDMIVPTGRGQRGLIIASPKTGKTTILKHYALAVEKNHPAIRLYILLVDERPEEVTDFKRTLTHGQVLSSSADESVKSHLRMTRLAMHTAMREAEFGHDVVVLIDSLTRMGRAFNKETESHSRTLSGGLAANALELPRRFFGAARNIENGGSLSVMASILVDTGSRMDEVIFQEFKGTGNLDLRLSQACAERRLYPAININESGTRKEELLLDEGEYLRVTRLRRMLGQMKEVEAMAYLLENWNDV